MTDNYRADLERAEKELAQYLEDRKRLDLEIAKRQFRTAALKMLVNDNEEVEEYVAGQFRGLTDAVFAAFQSAHPRALSPTGVRDRLESIAFPLGRYQNPMAAVHTVISRLFDARKIVAAKTEQGETGFVFNPLFTPVQPLNKLRAKMRDRGRK